MWVVVAGTIFAPWSSTRIFTSDPWTTSPFVGDRIATVAGELGRAYGAGVPSAAPLPFEHAPASTATARIVIASRADRRPADRVSTLTRRSSGRSRRTAESLPSLWPGCRTASFLHRDEYSPRNGPGRSGSAED